MAAHILSCPRMDWECWSPGLCVSSGVTAAIGSPENDRLSLLLFLMGKKIKGNRGRCFHTPSSHDVTLYKNTALTGLPLCEQVQ